MIGNVYKLMYHPEAGNFIVLEVSCLPSGGKRIYFKSGRSNYAQSLNIKDFNNLFTLVCVKEIKLK